MIPLPFLSFLDALARVGPALLAGTTLLLLVGCVALWRHHSPIHRQRLGELTLAAVLVWLGLALAPLPRPFEIAKLLASWKTGALALSADLREILHPKTDSPQASLPIESPLSHRNTSQPLAVGRLPIETRRLGRRLPMDRLEAGGPSRGQLVRTETTPSDPVWTAEFEVVTPAPFAVGGRPIGESRATSLAERVAALAKLPTGRLLAAIYVGGCGLCLAWLCLGRWLLRRVVQTAQPPDDWLRQTFERLMEANGAARTRLLVSPRYPRAMSFGIGTPTIVLPATQCRVENVERLQHVLRHELAHVRQRDAWSNLLLNGTFVLLYFHPCFWWLRSRVRMSAELVADEWAAGQSSRGDYARQLVAFARSCRGRALQPAGAAGVLNSSTQFARRMEMLIRREQPLATKSSPKWQAAILAGTVLCLAALTASIGAPARAQSQAPASPAATVGIPVNPSAPLDVHLDDTANRKVADKGPGPIGVAAPPTASARPAASAPATTTTTVVLDRDAVSTEERVKILERERDELRKEVAALKTKADAIKSYYEDVKGPRRGEHLGKRVDKRFDRRDSNFVPKSVSADSARLEQMRAFTLHFAQAADVKQALANLFGNQMRESPLSILADERTNRIIIFGGGDKELEIIERIIKLYDQPAAGDQPVPVEKIGEKTSPMELSVRLKSPDVAPKASQSQPAADQKSKRDSQMPAMPEEEFIPINRLVPTADSPTDLVALAVAYSDAWGQVHEYQHALDQRRAEAKLGIVNAGESLPAKLGHAQRKVLMLRGIINELRSAKEEQIKLGESRLATGSLTNSDHDALIERKAKLRALDKILATEEPDNGKHAQ